MRVPLTIADHLDRAVHGLSATGSGSSTSPTRPEAGSATLTYGRLGELARGAGRRARRARHRRGRAGGDRQPELGPPARRLLRRVGWGRVLVPINFRLTPEEIAYIVEHSGASVLLVDPELEDVARGHRRRSTGSCSAPTTDDALLRARRRARAVGRPTRTPPPPSTTRAAPRPARRACSSPTATSGSTPPRSAGTPACQRPRRLPAHAADVPLQRLGHAVRHRRRWACTQVVLRKVDGAEILRRVDAHGVTLLCGAPAVVAADPRRRRRPGTGRSRVGTAPASSSPAPRRPPAPSSGSRPSWAGSSSRSTASPRPRRCSP